MPTLKEIQEKIKTLDSGSKIVKKREVKELPGILSEEETIERIIEGNYEEEISTGILVATNKRLIFIVKGLLRLRVEDFPYDKISSIQYEKGIMMGKITIFASGNKASIRNVSKNQVKDFGDFVREYISQKSKSEQEHQKMGEDIVTKLENLAALKDKGILTEEEFQVQKKKMLEN